MDVQWLTNNDDEEVHEVRKKLSELKTKLNKNKDQTYVIRACTIKGNRVVDNLNGDDGDGHDDEVNKGDSSRGETDELDDVKFNSGEDGSYESSDGDDNEVSHCKKRKLTTVKYDQAQLGHILSLTWYSRIRNKQKME